MLRCKPNDIVQFIGGHDPSLSELQNLTADTMRGHVTKVTTFDPVSEHWRLVPPLRGTLSLGILTIDAQIVACSDDFLRPIRPSDGEDEMLRIAGKPDHVREELRAIRREMCDEGASS